MASAKGKLASWNEQQIRRTVALEIAREIEMLGPCAPAEHCANRFCPDCLRHTQMKRDAAIARRIGGVT